MPEAIRFHPERCYIVCCVATLENWLNAYPKSPKPQAVHAIAIDPHIEGIPVWAILNEFERAKREIAINQKNYLAWLPILSKYHVGLIAKCQVLDELSAAITTQWLKRENGMFGELECDERDKKAEEIVRQLLDYSSLKSHDRHISMVEAKRNIGFGEKIIDLAGDESYDNRKNALLSYHHTCEHTLRDTKVSKIIENHLGQVIYMFAKPQPVSAPMAEITNLENIETLMKHVSDNSIAIKKPAAEK